LSAPAWFHRLAQVLRTTAQGLTLWLPGTVLATLVALLVTAWLWTGSANSLAGLLTLARPFVPTLAQLSWTTPGATVRSGGPLGDLSWQHNGMAIQARQAQVQWQWLAHDPANTSARNAPTQSSRLRLTLKAEAVHITDHSPARTTPLAPPTDLALPWPFDSWAAPVELVFDIGTLTNDGAQALVVHQLNGQHVYNPAATDWPHHLTLHAQVQRGDATTGSASYTLEARAQAHAPLAIEATLSGDISGAMPVSTASTGRILSPGTRPSSSGQSKSPRTTSASAANAAAHPPTHTWQGQLTAKVTGHLATRQAQLNAQATLTSQTTPGQPTPSAQLKATLAPWAPQPVSSLHAQLAEMNLAALWPTLPQTRLSGRAQATPGKADVWAVDVALTNTASGPLDQQRLPVTALNTTGQVHTGAAATAITIQVDTLTAQVAGGQVVGRGHWATHAWSGELTGNGLYAPALHSALPPTNLQGSLRAAPDTARSTPPSASLINMQLSATPVATAPAEAKAGRAGTNTQTGKTDDSKQSIQIKRQAHFSSEFSWNGQQLDIRALDLRSDGGQLSAQGLVQRQPMSISGHAQLTAPGLQASAKGQLAPDTGSGSLTANLLQATPFAQWLARLPVWPTTWPAPQINGAASLYANWQGGWQTGLRVDATTTANQLSGVLPVSPSSPTTAAGKADATAPAHTATGTPWAARNLSWTLTGSPANWQSALTGQMHWAQWATNLDTTAIGALTPTDAAVSATAGRPALWAAGQARIHTLNMTLSRGAGTASEALNTPTRLPANTTAPAATTLQLTLPAAASLNWDASGWSLDAGALQAHTNAPQPAGNPPTRLRWDRTTWAAAQLSGSGELTGMTLPLVRTLAQLAGTTAAGTELLPGWTGNLTVGGPWQLRWPGNPSAPAQLAASLSRQSGDLQAPTSQTERAAQQTLGVRTASLTLKADAQHVSAEANWDSQWAGEARAQLALAHPTRNDWALPSGHSALSGQLTARLPQAGVWSKLAPPGWRVTGSLALDATLGGTLAQPTWQGKLAARQLSARSAVEGLEYSQGELDATLSDNRMDITRFSIQGAGGKDRGGSLALTGYATWAPPPATPTVSLQAKADRLNVSARADRRLTVSGTVATSLADHTLTLRGQLKADQAQFTLPDETAPTLGPDVIVRLNRASVPPPPVVGLRTDVAVDIDLGPAFDVRGQGLQAQLTGQLHVSSPPASDAFRVTGEVRAAQGSYKAYGQLLRIEEGVLRFSGPYDDPTLAILALRGSSTPTRTSLNSDTQKVGVKVTGSARSPHLQLYAEPELPDSEKLAWLVLGRPASGAGAEAAAMQQAAMALLGSQIRGMEGGLAHALGLDDISVAQQPTTGGGTGTTETGAAVTLGKRLSSRLYVAYEHSLNGANGALNLFYDVSRRLTVRAQVGGTNALDLIFTLPYD
jgi:translocation and assembly module TamB